MVMFSINGNDFSNRVVAENYKVQSNRIEQTWTDGNLKKHWVWMGKKSPIAGSFDMVFLTEQEYTNFANILKESTNNDGLVPVTLCDNRTDTEVTANVHISFTLSRGRKDTWEDYFEIVTITVEEA